MKGIYAVLLAIAGAVALSSCEKVVGEGPVVTETRNVTDFKGVSVAISGKVNYQVAPTYKVEVSAQRNILNVLQTERHGDELVIKFREGTNVKSHEEIIINISAPVAEFANLSGSAELTVMGDIVSPALGLRVSGSGNIVVSKAITDDLTATITGSGNIRINQGSSFNEKLKISGSGNIDVSEITGSKVQAEISGSGHIRVHAVQTLNATISGSGSVFYKGTPQISTSVSGSGSVRPL